MPKSTFLEYHKCQTVWIQLMPDILSSLIWAQTICTGYQQTPIIGKKSIDNSLCNFSPINFKYQNQLFRKILSGIPSVSNSLDPVKARHFVGRDSKAFPSTKFITMSCLTLAEQDYTCDNSTRAKQSDFLG